MFIPPMDMRVTSPRLDLGLSWPRLRIDQTLAKADIGLKAMGPLMQEAVAKAQGAGTQAIADTAQEGDRLARVEESSNAIMEIAADKWPPARELNVDLAPKHRPEIQAEPGQLTVQLQPGRVQIQVPRLLGSGRIVDILA